MTAGCAPTLREVPAQSHSGRDTSEPLLEMCARRGGVAPPENKCRFAARIVEVRRKYGLTIDRREADALERVLLLSSCSSTEMVIGVCSGGRACREAYLRI